MANIAEVSEFTATVYQLATADPVEGGPGGVANSQAQSLANRTLFLKNQADAVWRTGDVKEVDCDAAYIAANFDGTGLGTNERLGWAICNGANGTKDRGGRVSIGYGNGYTTMSAVVGNATHQLTRAQIPNLHLTVPVSDADNGGGAHTYVMATDLEPNGTKTYLSSVNPSSGVIGDAHNIIQPSIVTLFIQKL